MVGADWKIGRRLTLNLGVRYEYAQPFREDQSYDILFEAPKFEGERGIIIFEARCISNGGIKNFAERTTIGGVQLVVMVGVFKGGAHWTIQHLSQPCSRIVILPHVLIVRFDRWCLF